MANVNLYLRDKNSQEKSPINLLFSFDGKRLKRSTGYQVSPKLWDEKKQLVRSSFPNSFSINEGLKRLKGEYERAYFDLRAAGKSITNEALTKRVDEALGVKRDGDINLLTFFAEYIHSVPNRKPGTIKSYKSAYKALQDFQKKTRTIEFDSITLEWYDDFFDFLQNEKEFSKNYIGKVFRILKTILNVATERGVNKNMAFKSRSFKTYSEDVNHPYLTEEEIQRIFDLDLSEKPTLGAVRDNLIIGCWSGVRFGDLSRLRKENLSESTLKIKTQKTGEVVVIPILPQLRAILDKYKDTPTGLPKVLSNQKMNVLLKQVAAYAGIDTPYFKTITKGGQEVKIMGKKYEFISSHCCRRSFASNMYVRGIPAITIMKITGHRTERSFLKYIKISAEQNAALFAAKFYETEKLPLQIA